MPFLRLETSAALSGAAQKNLMTALSKLVADALGKPEAYVMIVVQPASMLLGGTDGPAAFIDLRSIGGLSDTINRQLSLQLCGLLREQLHLSPDRVYLNFQDVPPVQWGWNGSTFG